MIVWFPSDWIFLWYDMNWWIKNDFMVPIWRDSDDSHDLFHVLGDKPPTMGFFGINHLRHQLLQDFETIRVAFFFNGTINGTWKFKHQKWWFHVGLTIKHSNSGYQSTKTNELVLHKKGITKNKKYKDLPKFWQTKTICNKPAKMMGLRTYWMRCCML